MTTTMTPSPSEPQAETTNEASKLKPFASMAEAWNSYRHAAIPHQAGPIQVRDTRWAFYAGAATILDMVLSMSDMGDNQAADALARLHTEMFEYAMMEKAEQQATQGHVVMPTPGTTQ